MGNFITIAKTTDIPVGKALSVSVESKAIAVFNIEGKYFAISDECTHAGGNLSEGEVKGTTVTCPWHGAQFDVTTGSVLSAPAFDNVPSYSLRVIKDEIQIGIS